MNPSESAAAIALSSTGQHSVAQEASPVALVMAGPSSDEAAAVIVSLSVQHAEEHVVSPLASPAMGVEFIGLVVSEAVAEQHSAAQTSAPYVSVGALLAQQVLAQFDSSGTAVVITAELVGVVEVSHGVGQQSSGPANAAKEMMPRPNTPMVAGARR